MLEVLNTKEKVYSFLQSHCVGVLSTISEDGLPEGSPIYFVTDKDLNFFFLTKSETKKSQNMERNNVVAITVVDPSVPITIQAEGSVTEVADEEMYTKIAEANAQEKGGFHWPPPLYKLHHSGDLLMYKFTPQWLRVADFSDSEKNSATDIFHEIIPHK